MSAFLPHLHLSVDSIWSPQCSSFPKTTPKAKSDNEVSLTFNVIAKHLEIVLLGQDIKLSQDILKANFATIKSKFLCQFFGQFPIKWVLVSERL